MPSIWSERSTDPLVGWLRAFGCDLDPGDRFSLAVHDGAFDTVSQRQELHDDRVGRRSGGRFEFG